jgi:hypothetical protein
VAFVVERKVLPAAVVLAGADIVALSPTAAAAPPSALVHASPANDCLNVRAGADVGSTMQVTSRAART